MKITAKKKRILALIVAAFFLLSIFFYIAGHCLEPYAIAKKYIYLDDDIYTEFGSIKRTLINPFGGFRVKSNRDKGWAKYVIRVYGEKGSGDVRFYFKRHADKWQISTAEIINKKEKQGQPPNK